MFGIGKYGACSDPMYRALNKTKCDEIMRNLRTLYIQQQKLIDSNFTFTPLNIYNETFLSVPKDVKGQR